MRALRRVIPYYRPYKLQVAWGLGLVVISGAFAALVPWLLRTAIDGMRAGAALRQTFLLAAGMVAAAMAAGVARYLMRELLNGVSRRIETDLRDDLFAQLERLDAAFFGRMRTGDLMARLTNDLSAVRMAAGPAIMYLANTVAGGLFALGFMLGISPRLTLLAVLPMLSVPVLMIKVGRVIHRRFEVVQEHFSDMTTLVQESLAGTRIVRAYRQEQPELERFRRMNDKYVALNLDLARLWGLVNPAFALQAGIGMIVVLGFGGFMLIQGTLSVGAFVAFGFYLGMLTWPLIALGWVINLFERGSASMARLADLLDARSEVKTAEPALPVPPAAGGRELEFREVGFHYPARQGEAPRWVLRNVSFRVPAGATLGVAGATGSGKSALMDLIPRVYDPQEGEILLDGLPISRLDIEELRREIGYVTQDTVLFSESIRSNLTYGGASEPDAMDAARVAQLDQTVRDFPGGYDTLLGERGINLSGGQKQRAALARALARHPHVVLLDDALSAVDTDTEAAILHGLRSALGGRTALIASHRASALRETDIIIVLEDGRLVETGTHEELLQRSGRYWSLVNRQQLLDSLESSDNGEDAALTSRDSRGTLQQ